MSRKAKNQFVVKSLNSNEYGSGYELVLLTTGEYDINHLFSLLGCLVKCPTPVPPPKSQRVTVDNTLGVD